MSKKKVSGSELVGAALCTIEQGKQNAALRDRYLALCAAADAVSKNILGRDRALPAVVFEINGEGASAVITVTPVNDSWSARRAAASAIRLFAPKEEVGDIHRVFRLPGAIAASAETILLVRELNTAKRYFEQTAKEIEPSQRLEVLKRTMRSIPHLKQCYRTVPVYDPAPAVISFTWVSGNHAWKPLTRDAAADLIQSAIAKGTYPTIGGGELEEALAHVRGGPCNHFLRRLPVAPHPRINILTRTGTRENLTPVASLPVFYAHDASPPHVIPLQDRVARQRAARSDSHRGKAVLAGMHLYEK